MIGVGFDSILIEHVKLQSREKLPTRNAPGELPKSASEMQ
jgi:hypothetical protein